MPLIWPIFTDQSLGCRNCPPGDRRQSGEMGHCSSGTTPGRPSHLPQHRRLPGRKRQEHPTSRTRGLVSRPHRKQQKPTPLQEWLLLSGMHPPYRSDRGDGRCTALLASQDRASAQSPATSRQRILFRNKNNLARRMLEALRPLSPQGWRVYSYAVVDKYMVVVLFFMLLR